jgi:hypothetical protein
MFRRIYGPLGMNITGGRIKSHDEKLHILYSSSNIMRVSKPRRTRLAEHVE